jgi:hypothetical protein
MQNNRIPVLILVLSLCCVSASQSSGLPAAKSPKASDYKLKAVDLDGKYTIQVPSYFTLGRVGAAATAVPMYFFKAPIAQHTTIQVSVMPLGGIIPIDKNTGRFQLPFQCDGGLPPLTDYFEISGNRDVYYGWSIIDNAYECSMNSPCPLPVSPTSRYTTQYAFAVLDETSCVEFTGMHDGPSKVVTGFEGDGKLLRDIIVPSLQSFH